MCKDFQEEAGASPHQGHDVAGPPEDLGNLPGAAAKIIRVDGASWNATIYRLPDGSVRIEGADGIRNGERLLLVITGEPVLELSVRWVIGDQAGAIVPA